MRGIHPLHSVGNAVGRREEVNRRLQPRFEQPDMPLVTAADGISIRKAE
jgi:hypothetical protein